MSTLRRKAGGWVNPRTLPRGPSGRALCRQCGEEVGKGRRSFCSVACVHNHLLRSSPQYLREQVFKRDKGVCAACGVNTMQGVLRPRARGTGHMWQAHHQLAVVEGGGECDLSNIETRCTACHLIETRELAARRAAEKRQNEKP